MSSKVYMVGFSFIAIWCGLRRVIPAHVNALAHGLHCHILLASLCDGRIFALGRFTHRVSISKPRQAAPALGLRQFWIIQLRFPGSFHVG